VPTTPEGCVELFPAWLERACAFGQSVVILIDGLDQLSDPVAATLRWLPSTLPANCSLILSTSAGTPSSAALPRRGWKHTLQMPPLTEAMKQLFIEQYLGHLRKGLEKEVLGELMSARQTSNPLFLRMTIDELVAVAVHETVLPIAEHCCSLNSCLELCGMLLERCEEERLCLPWLYLPMAMLTMAMLTMAMVTMAMLTMAMLTMAMLTVAMLTMAMVAMAMLTHGYAYHGYGYRGYAYHGYVYHGCTYPWLYLPWLYLPWPHSR
jgi:hypothetical protein